MSKSAIPLAGLFFGASFLAALALQNANLGHLPWYLSRSSGIASFVMLTAAMVMGLLISTKAGDPHLKRPFAFDMHQFLSVLSLTLIGVHAGSLMFDGFLRFSPAQILVPFTSPYEPFWTGLGIIAAWLAATVTASFWMRKRIGQKRWRKLHYATFAAYLLGLGHGFAAGTDSQVPIVFWIYVISAAMVAALLAYRLVAVFDPPPKPVRRPAMAARAPRERAEG